MFASFMTAFAQDELEQLVELSVEARFVSSSSVALLAALFASFALLFASASTDVNESFQLVFASFVTALV
jgi:hypothetical protein